MILDAKHKTSERAYFIWEALGRPEGHALEHWLQAEAELAARPGVEPRAQAELPAAPELESKPKKKPVKKKTKAARARKKTKKSS